MDNIIIRQDKNNIKKYLLPILMDDINGSLFYN
nr:MAG TPA: hypothetical protein [Caudoviricetes sp.]